MRPFFKDKKREENDFFRDGVLMLIRHIKDISMLFCHFCIIFCYSATYGIFCHAFV